MNSTPEQLNTTAGQLAVVTGASSGIGLELARLCAQQRWDFIIAADEPLIENAAGNCRQPESAVPRLNATSHRRGRGPVDDRHRSQRPSGGHAARECRARPG